MKISRQALVLSIALNLVLLAGVVYLATRGPVQQGGTPAYLLPTAQAPSPERFQPAPATFIPLRPVAGTADSGAPEAASSPSGAQDAISLQNSVAPQDTRGS